MSTRYDVITGPIGLKFGTNIAITVHRTSLLQILLDSAKRGPFTQIWEFREIFGLVIAQRMNMHEGRVWPWQLDMSLIPCIRIKLQRQQPEIVHELPARQRCNQMVVFYKCDLFPFSL
jgi:hypothetical protein